ncbi:phage portal protein [Lysinibacillus mangiferihumi]|uniref:Phage portal protein n=1 Tax=Lysinibacillus mangiferihumi TaxID=1130819 RepID=A0A4U2ZE34_9BACI|nr:phage portal protein [Lysinibacillus mangiferihumi]TKI72634.1 phage portal protein [Lysinibacillus mangiferihumi]
MVNYKPSIMERIRYVVTGEMSKMRTSTIGLFGRIKGVITGRYQLDTSKVDYDMARALYENTQEGYKLGAGFARVVINNRAAFMGIPMFSSTDPNAQVVLDTFQEENKSNFIRTIIEFLRDGDCYVYVSKEAPYEVVLHPEKQLFVKLTFIDAKAVDIEVDPITHNPIKYTVTQTIKWTDELGNENSAEVQQVHTVGYTELKLISGLLPSTVKEGRTPTGLSFIPIQHFKNAYSHSLYGNSELEPIEPYLKVYHDIMIHAMQGSKMHSTPKLGLYVKDVNKFKKVNFPTAKPQEEVDLTGREIFIFDPAEKAEFIEPSNPTGAAKDLLKLTFYNIVDASETPEFVFGVHTPSSLSSVQEQMPILIRSIERKREQMTQAWQRLARMVLYFSSGMEGYKKPDTFATDIVWDNVDYRTNEEISKELVNVVTAITTAVAAELMSKESAVDFLSKFVHTMKPYDPEEGVGEKERIDKTIAEKMRMPDYENVSKEYQDILKQLKELGLDVSDG